MTLEKQEKEFVKSCFDRDEMLRDLTREFIKTQGECAPITFSISPEFQAEVDGLRKENEEMKKCFVNACYERDKIIEELREKLRNAEEVNRVFIYELSKNMYELSKKSEEWVRK